MNKVMHFLIYLGGFLVAAALIGLLYYSLQPTTLRIAVGPAGSADVKVIQAIAQAFADEGHSVRLKAVITNGAAASAALLKEEKVELAVVRVDIDVPKDAQSVAILRKNIVVLWIPNAPGRKKDSNIKKIENLAGRRVGIIGSTSANVNLLRTILTASGVSPERVQTLQFSTNEISDALRNQKVDAFMAVGPVDSPITLGAISATTRSQSSPTFLPVDAAEIIARKSPIYEASQIAAGALGATPPRPDDDITTIGLNHLIVVRKAISEQTVTAFTKQLFAIRHSLQKEFPGVAEIETPDTDKAAAILAHPGAAAYIDGNERTFLERYSDYMWLGLMVLSGLATGGAGFRSYLKRNQRAHNTLLRNRMLDMIAAARESKSIEELDSMQKEADDILRDTLDCFEDGAVQEDILSAFNIALDQFHNAVADRKLWIDNSAGRA